MTLTAHLELDTKIDFDIDKLFMYEPELDDDGNLILSNKDFQKNPASVYEFIKFRQ